MSAARWLPPLRLHVPDLPMVSGYEESMSGAQGVSGMRPAAFGAFAEADAFAWNARRGL